jgi:hypothetical protein
LNSMLPQTACFETFFPAGERTDYGSVAARYSNRGFKG